MGVPLFLVEKKYESMRDKSYTKLSCVSFGLRGESLGHCCAQTLRTLVDETRFEVFNDRKSLRHLIKKKE
ncbi:hypothetical protein CR513_19696, partial [Mucuna pruriens]